MARERPTGRPSLSRGWSAEEDALFLEMLQQGRSLSSIAVKLKRTISAIYHRKAILQAGVNSALPHLAQGIRDESEPN